MVPATTALPQRVFGTHLPPTFYSSTAEPAPFRAVAPVPTECLFAGAQPPDALLLTRIRDGLRRLAGPEALECQAAPAGATGGATASPTPDR